MSHDLDPVGLEVQVVEDAPDLRARNPDLGGERVRYLLPAPVACRLGRSLGHGLDDFETVVVTVNSRPSRTVAVAEASKALLSEAFTPLAHGVGIDRQLLGDVLVGHPFGREQDDAGALDGSLLAGTGVRAGFQLLAFLGGEGDNGRCRHGDLLGWTI